MSVVGIDLGSLSTVVAVARNKGIDVICNDVSNRATPSLVTFAKLQRFIGEGAKTMEISNFHDTVSSLIRLVGRDFNDPDITRESKFVNCALVDQDNQVAAQVSFKDQTHTFTYTQILAMFLNHVSKYTSAELKAPVNDCVISCPGWFTEKQRRAILDAAEISGLKCLRLLNCLTAAALGYGITKTDLPEPVENQPGRIVCFVDIGYSSYQISFVEFVKGKLIVLGTAYDKYLGGRDFDDVLVDKFTLEFNEKHKFDLNKNAKSKFRLRSACEKVKKVLSANATTVLNIECLLDDKDVKSTITRSEFEVLVEPLVKRLTGPLEQALLNAKLTIQQVDAVELVGGSTRIPIVKETLANFFGGSINGENKLSTTLNLDEAVARGCALQCAIISPVFKVRDFTVVDWNAYPVILEWDGDIVPTPKEGEKDVSVEIFPVASQIPSAKNATLHRIFPQDNVPATFNLTANYTPEAFTRGAPIGVGKEISKFIINGIQKHPEASGETRYVPLEGEPKAIIKFKARLDGNGIFGIDSCHQCEDFMVPVIEEKQKDAAADSPVPVKTKRVTRKFELNVETISQSLSKPVLESFRNLEINLESSDKLVLDTSEKRNQLEEYVYDTRSSLEMPWSDFISDDQKSIFMKLLNEMENWLYTEEGESATKSIYMEKLAGLKKIGDPIHKRLVEFETRPIAERTFKEYVNGVVASLGDEKFEHISKSDLDIVRSECKSKMDWLNDAIGKQNEISKAADCVVTVDEINRNKDALAFKVNPILNKPKPKSEVKKENEEPVAKKESKENDSAKDVAMDGTDEPVADTTDMPQAMEVD